MRHTRTGMCAHILVDIEKRAQFVADAVEGPRLDARGRLHRVSVRGVATPQHHTALPLHRADELRQVRADVAGPHTSNDGDPPGDVGWVQGVD